MFHVRLYPMSMFQLYRVVVHGNFVPTVNFYLNGHKGSQNAVYKYSISF